MGTGTQLRTLPSKQPKIRQASYHQRIKLWGWLFVAPTIVFFIIFKYGPMLFSFWLSFSSYDMVSKPRFIGLYNYESLFNDPLFIQALKNTLLYIAFSTSAITVVAFALALLVNVGIRGSRHFMSTIFLTNILPVIACCYIWRFLFHPDALVNQLLSPFGFGRIQWLTEPTMAMLALVIVTVWRFAPYFMVVYLAGLVAIPKDYYEAASLDGANALARLLHITLPSMRPVIFFVIVVSGLLSARIFLFAYLITQGGPSGATTVLSMLIYDTGFSYLKMGRAAAMSVILFLIVMFFTVMQMRIFMRSEED